MPKMIKIGEVRVLNHFDLTWTEPQLTPQPMDKPTDGFPLSLPPGIGLTQFSPQTMDEAMNGF